MRRAAAGIASVVALAGVAPPVGSIALGAPASGEGCSWHRHSRRVVAHVKRHGRARTVRRAKHWWTCDPSPATVTSPTPPPAPPPEETSPGASRLSVKAAEWHYTLSRPELSAGEAIVELDNQGEDSHNLKLQREGSDEPPLAVPEAAAGERTAARLDLPPGTYHLYCSLYQHDEKGMHATLVVGGG